MQFSWYILKISIEMNFLVKHFQTRNLPWKNLGETKNVSLNITCTSLEILTAPTISSKFNLWLSRDIRCLCYCYVSSCYFYGRSRQGVMTRVNLPNFKLSNSTFNHWIWWSRFLESVVHVFIYSLIVTLSYRNFKIIFVFLQ